MQTLLTEPEVAKILRLSQRSVRNARLSGELPHLRIGRSIRYRADDLDTFLVAASCAPTRTGTKRKQKSIRAPSAKRLRSFTEQEGQA
ncbi:helix-turn-helix domain-containing protein [Novosphingobium huizhouense]|uniref:helix-turn-helix domain-containing protein n=1 Tax=Novosphingobium huizhouense TaxID=2866625 RepID=UPI001CD82D0B|nr:helix-turn-helix domain-containing protein [Novosphingobium huizhouense]